MIMTKVPVDPWKREYQYELVDGDNERPDYDPAYLVRQNGEWKVLLKFIQWDERRFTFTDEQKIRFAELKKWFHGEKDRLYGRN